MGFEVGIVGLPNVGKSTLFQALTKAQVAAENYPFCTIEPNVGIVPLPDQRLNQLAEISGSEKLIHSTVKFVDIAGLVKGASKGEGLGNTFLDHIRQVEVICHVVRCFEDENVIHVDGKIDPISDIDTINIELIYADEQKAEKIKETLQRKAKSQDKEILEKLTVIDKLLAQLSQARPIRALNLDEKDEELISEYQFLTQKKVLYVANVDEKGIQEDNQLVRALKTYCENESAHVLKICCQLEQTLSSMADDEIKLLLEDYGLSESGLARLSVESFKLLNLQTFLTTGKKETRSWTIVKGTKAPQAAGVIHSDFEKTFIRVNVLSFDDFMANKGLKEAKEKGVIRQEGKDYEMKEGDVVEFLCSA